jgi:glucose-6-phosphate 1-dehydrogenase
VTRPEPVTIVIFGGAGDLSHRKLIPALYNLHVDHYLPDRYAIVALGRKPMDDAAFRDFAKEGVQHFSRRPPEEAAWSVFAQSLFFVNVDIGDASAFPRLGSRLDTIEHERNLPRNRIYYLAVPSSMFVPTIQQLARSRFVVPGAETPFARVVVEKPIGHDLQSAKEINDAIAAVFEERQIFRIDHYLGKETVQNLLVLRFANSFFEPVFNHTNVDHVQITVAESEGVGSRAGYYEQAGALRDMVQNHLLQLVSLVAMEPPYSLTADVVRDEKLEVVQALRPITGESVDALTVRAQYASGIVEGKQVPAYGQERDVAPGSRTETFVALQLFIDNWRWAGVPFFVRTGKRLKERTSVISIQLKSIPPILFNRDAERPLAPNVLTIRIQPDEGFALGISSKVPGPRLEIRPVQMDFDYCSAFGMASPEAYERLLLDVMLGDATLFMRRDGVEKSWEWIMPILDRWTERQDGALPEYPAGGVGPTEADRLIEATGRRWFPL